MSVRTWAEAISMFQISNGSISHPLGWWSVCISNITSLSHSLSPSPPPLICITKCTYTYKNIGTLYIDIFYIHIVGFFHRSTLDFVNEGIIHGVYI